MRPRCPSLPSLAAPCETPTLSHPCVISVYRREYLWLTPGRSLLLRRFVSPYTAFIRRPSGATETAGFFPWPFLQPNARGADVAGVLVRSGGSVLPRVPRGAHGFPQLRLTHVHIPSSTTYSLSLVHEQRILSLSLSLISLSARALSGSSLLSLLMTPGLDEFQRQT